MSVVQTGIVLQDNFTNVIYQVMNTVNMCVSAMENLSQTMNTQIDADSIDSVRESINQATLAAQELDAAMQRIEPPDIPLPAASQDSAPPVDPPVQREIPQERELSPERELPQEQEIPRGNEAPFNWQTENLEIFTNSGAERFQQEVQSANDMLNTLNQTQTRIAETAARAGIFPPDMVNDMGGMQNRLQAIQQQIQLIENNPLNMGSDTANAELEQLRAQLSQAVSEQNRMNRAIEDLDIQEANEAYLRLQQIVGGTERHIRDNVDEQGRFNREIQEGASNASNLNSIISKAVGVFAGLFGINQIFSFATDSMKLFDTQLNAETQLVSVLANMMDDDHVAQYMVETQVEADTSDAVETINNITSNTDDVVVTVEARTQALQAEFDAITAKASEIQANGIFGDEAMISGAAELSTYFTDTDAIEMMMDTLSNYAIGMSNGTAVDASGMVDYATGLGKIMTGSYEAMTKKGFEFTDAQKAIIEGTATQEQIAAQLGSEYLSMSEDMQAAAAITQVIDEGWGGLYETMSDTPRGRIIQMTNAWGDMKEVVGEQLYPYVDLFVRTIISNWGMIQGIINKFTKGLTGIMSIMSLLLSGAFSVASAIADNWSVISPIVYGIAAALAIYHGWQLASNAASLISHGIHIAMAAAQMIHAAATKTLTADTAAQIAAQNGLNAALAACPIMWIVILIIAAVAAVYALCVAIAKMTGIAGSGFGVMAGGINVVLQFFKNLALNVANMALGISNAISALTGNMMTAFNNAICNIQVWFYDLLSTSLQVIEGICAALNKLPFVNIDYSGISSAANDYAAKAQAAANNKKEYTNIADAFNKGITTFDTFKEGWIMDAFDAGAAWGDGIADAVSNFSLTDALGIDVEQTDYRAAMDALGDNVGSIANDAGNISDALDISSEDLKYLRDIAEQETVNRYTVAEISVDMSNMQNNINSDDDIDGFVAKLNDSVNEAVDYMTEGVHA